MQMIILACGCALFLSLLVYAFARLRRTSGQCPSCRYDLRNFAGEVCPECGVTTIHAAQRLRRSQQRVLAIAGCVALLTPATMWSAHHGWSPPLPAYRHVKTISLPDGTKVSSYLARDPHIGWEDKYAIACVDGTRGEGLYVSFMAEPASGMREPGPVLLNGELTSANRILAIQLTHSIEDRFHLASVYAVDKTGVLKLFMNDCDAYLDDTSDAPSITIWDPILARAAGWTGCGATFAWNGTEFVFDPNVSITTSIETEADVDQWIPHVQPEENANPQALDAIADLTISLLLQDKPDLAWRLFKGACPDTVPGKQERRALIESAFRTSPLVALTRRQRAAPLLHDQPH